MEAGQGQGLSCLSHFFLHQLAPLASTTCLVWLVSEFTSLDLMASVSSRPHHPILSASHLASTPLILSLTISPVLDRLLPSSQILLPWPMKLNTNLFRKKRGMLLPFYFILLALLTPPTLNYRHSLCKADFCHSLFFLLTFPKQTPVGSSLTDPTYFLHICLPHVHLQPITPSLPGGLGIIPNASHSEQNTGALAH